MRRSIQKFWLSFLKNPDTWVFYAFLTTLTLSVRKVLFYIPVENSFNEYTGVYIYLSDILLILTFLLYILYNKKIIVSTIATRVSSCSQSLRLFHVEQASLNISHIGRSIPPKSRILIVSRGTISQIKKAYQLIIHNYLIIFPLSLAIFSFISIAWSVDKSIALFRSIKLLEFIFLYLYVYKNFSTHALFHVEQFNTKKPAVRLFEITPNKIKPKYSIVPRETILEKTLLIIIVTGTVNALIGLVQFFMRHSIGIFWLRESTIGMIIPGVAKVILNGNVYIRAYGLFPHPNILGGFLVLSIISTAIYHKFFYKSQIQCSTWNITKCSHIINVPRGTILFNTLLAIQSLAIILTFSKSAIIGLTVGLIYLLLAIKPGIVPCGTVTNRAKAFKNMFHVEHIRQKTLLTLIMLLLIFLVAKPDINSLFLNSLRERGLYLNVSRETFMLNPLMGVGSGQFVPNMAQNYTLKDWQYQPVHNVFFLILNDFGIVITLGFIYFILKFLNPNRNNPSGGKCFTWNNLRSKHGTVNEDMAELPSLVVNKESRKIIEYYFLAILTAFIFIMLFDHYLWDIQQGSLMLWMTMGLITASMGKLRLDH